jgi:hypothetical protein
MTTELGVFNITKGMKHELKSKVVVRDRRNFEQLRGGKSL